MSIASSAVTVCSVESTFSIENCPAAVTTTMAPAVGVNTTSAPVPPLEMLVLLVAS